MHHTKSVTDEKVTEIGKFRRKFTALFVVFRSLSGVEPEIF